RGDLLPDMVSTIAKELEVPEVDVVEMNRRLSGPDHSLNATIADDADNEWIDVLQDERPDQESLVGEAEEEGRRHGLLEAAIEKLDNRERAIVIGRRLKDQPSTLEELSRQFAISCERVRQIELRAVEKLKRTILSSDGLVFPGVAAIAARQHA